MLSNEQLIALAKKNPENKKLQEDVAIAQRMEADPEFRAQRRAEFQREFFEGAKFAPFRIAGGTVDFVNMGLGTVGLGSKKPFLGSDYMIDKYATGIEALGGSYRRPTGSGAELAGDILGSTLNVAGATKGLSRLFGRAFKKGQGVEIQGTSTAQLDTPSSVPESPTPAPATITDLETGTTSVLEPPAPKAGFGEVNPQTTAPGTKPGGIGMYGINPPFKELEDVPVSMLGLGKTSYSALGDALGDAEDVLGVGKGGMTGAQYLNRLKKLPSVTDQELTNTGVMSVLQKNKNTNMSPDELRAVYNENAPKISVNVRKASDEVEVENPDTGDIEYVTVDDNVNPGDYDFVEYREEQRLVSQDEDYYEILYNNTNRKNNDYGSYSHYADEDGNFGHTRAGIIKGPPDQEGSSIRRLGMFVEEHQSDIEKRFRDVQQGAEEAIFISPEKKMKLKEIQEKALNHPEYQDALDQEVALKDLRKKLLDTGQRSKGYGDALVDEITILDHEIGNDEMKAATKAGNMIDDGASDAEVQAFYDVYKSQEAVKQARLNELRAELATATQPYKDALPGLQAQLNEARALQNQRLSRLFENDRLADKLKRATERGGFIVVGSKSDEDIEDIFVAASTSGGKLPFSVFSNTKVAGGLVNTPPFTDQLSMAKFQNRATINKAMQDGLDFVAFPDYRDVSSVRTGARGGEEAFKITYKDARDSVLKELKNQFDVKVKTISPDEFVENYAGADVNHPVTVLDLSSIPPVTPRRFAKGGPVDLRSGIGDMFRLYS